MTETEAPRQRRRRLLERLDILRTNARRKAGQARSYDRQAYDKPASEEQ